MSTQYELRLLIKGAGWPVEVLAKKSGVPLNVVRQYVEEDKGMMGEDFARFSAWADLHKGVTSTNVPIFDKFREEKIMPALVYIDAAELPRGKKFVAGTVSDVIHVIDEDKTRAAVGAYMAHKGGALTGVGTTIRADKVAAGEQVLKPKAA